MKRALLLPPPPAQGCWLRLAHLAARRRPALAVGGHYGYTCMVPVGGAECVVDGLFFNICGCRRSSCWGCGTRALGQQQQRTAAGWCGGRARVLLGRWSGTLVEDFISCWEPMPMTSHPSIPWQQQQQQLQLMQPHPLLLPTSGGGAAAGLGWDEPLQLCGVCCVSWQQQQHERLDCSWQRQWPDHAAGLPCGAGCWAAGRPTATASASCRPWHWAAEGTRSC